jgi:cytochrome c oxidase assembly protein Cox11
MKNTTLLMVGIVAAVAMLSAGLAVVPIQQVSAQDTDFDFQQDQENRCSGAAECSNEGTITFGSPAMDDSVVSFPLSE